MTASDLSTETSAIRRNCPQYTGEQMMQRWFRSMMKPTTGNRGNYAWVYVSEIFAVGSTVAMDQCEKYGQNPHQRVRKICR